MKKYIVEAFKPVQTPFKFESNIDNVRYAFKTIEDLLKDKDQLEALKTSFGDGKYSRVQKDIPVSIKVLKYISGLGNYTKDEEHAKIVNGLKDSKIEKKAENLLMKVYNVNSKKEIQEEKSIDDYVKNYIKSAGLAPTKEEQEKAEKEKQEEPKVPEQKEEQKKEAKAPEEPEAKEEPEEPPKVKSAEEIEQDIEKDVDKGTEKENLDPDLVIKDLISSFDEKYKEVLSKVSSYPEEKAKAIKKEIDKQKELFKKQIADIRKQETPYSGNYGDTTKMRAGSKIKIAKQNAEYITKGLDLKADIKGSKGELETVLKGAKDNLKSAGNAIKNKAEKIANSYQVQKAAGKAKEVIDKTSSAVKQTTEKVIDKIISNTDKKQLEKVTTQLGKEKAMRFQELKDKIDNKTINTEEMAEFNSIKQEANKPKVQEPPVQTPQATEQPPAAQTVAQPVANAPQTPQPAPLPAQTVADPQAAPIDTAKAIQKRLASKTRLDTRAKSLENPAEQSRFTELANKQRSPEEEQEFVALNKKIEAMKLRAKAST